MRTARVLQASLFVLFCLALTAQADDVLESIERGKSSYLEGKYALANSELAFAISQIQTRLSDLYAETLPTVPEGWRSDGPETQSGAMSMFGGGTGVHVSYEKEPQEREDGEYAGEYQSVTVDIVSDSPMLSSVMMMLGNPMFMSGGRSLVVGGNKAIEEWNEGGDRDNCKSSSKTGC